MATRIVIPAHVDFYASSTVSQKFVMKLLSSQQSLERLHLHARDLQLTEAELHKYYASTKHLTSCQAVLWHTRLMPIPDMMGRDQTASLESCVFKEMTSSSKIRHVELRCPMHLLAHIRNHFGDQQRNFLSAITPLEEYIQVNLKSLHLYDLELSKQPLGAPLLASLDLDMLADLHLNCCSDVDWFLNMLLKHYENSTCNLQSLHFVIHQADDIENTLELLTRLLCAPSGLKSVFLSTQGLTNLTEYDVPDPRIWLKAHGATLTNVSWLVHSRDSLSVQLERLQAIVDYCPRLTGLSIQWPVDGDYASDVHEVMVSYLSIIALTFANQIYRILWLKCRLWSSCVLRIILLSTHDGPDCPTRT